jgi:hypothetical protein
MAKQVYIKAFSKLQFLKKQPFDAACVDPQAETSTIYCGL